MEIFLPIFQACQIGIEVISGTEHDRLEEPFY